MGILITLFTGRAAYGVDDLSPAERRSRILGLVAQALGDRALQPVEFMDQVWANEEWSGGASSPFLTPGALTTIGAGLREPVGPFHWAGTHMAAEIEATWKGHSPQCVGRCVQDLTIGSGTIVSDNTSKQKPETVALYRMADLKPSPFSPRGASTNELMGADTGARIASGIVYFKSCEIPFTLWYDEVLICHAVEESFEIVVDGVSHPMSPGDMMWRRRAHR